MTGIDLFMERGPQKYLMEVKGCTLERKGVGYFPDAPTERGLKHIRELIGAKKAGVRILFLRCHVEPDSLTVVS